MTSPGEHEAQRFDVETEGITASASQNRIHQEVVIDIHVRHLKLQITEIAEQPDDQPDNPPIELPVRIIWSRGKKQAKTQYKKLGKNVDTAVFDEKVQINTVLPLNADNGMPTK